jgi:septal ring factor EnvC (AmiA/AmiB activator)
MKKTLVGGITALLLIGTPLGVMAQSTNINEARSNIAQWVDTRMKTAEKEANWREEKASIEKQIALYQEEIEGLQKIIDENSDKADDAAKKRSDLENQLNDLQNANKSIASQISVYEMKIRDAYKYFPTPLQEKVETLYNRLPEEGAKKITQTTGSRLAIVVGILNETDKFNNTVTTRKENKTIGGKEIEVDVVYFGLSMAVYADETGEHAGVGYPAKGEWTWAEMDAKAPTLRRTVMVATNTLKPAEFTQVPLKVTNID